METMDSRSDLIFLPHIPAPGPAYASLVSLGKEGVRGAQGLAHARNAWDLKTITFPSHVQRSKSVFYAVDRFPAT